MRASYPRFRRDDTPQQGMALTSDDRAIIRAVYDHRFIRASDLYRLFPNRSPDRLSRRLTNLFRHGYLDRPLSQVDRFRQGGSESLAYGLGAEGAKLLKLEVGASIASADWKAKNRAYTRESLDHTLGIAAYLVTVEAACRASADYTYISSGKVLKERNSGKWSVPVSWRGNFAEVLLIPDAVFALRRAAADGQMRQAYFFLEYDRGTMTIAPSEQVVRSEAFLYRSSVLRKFVAYAESHRRRLHEQVIGAVTPRLITLTTSAARLSSMQDAAAAVLADLALPKGLFLFGLVSASIFQDLVDAGGATVTL